MNAEPAPEPIAGSANARHQLAGVGGGALAMIAWAASGVIAKGVDLPGMAGCRTACCCTARSCSSGSRPGANGCPGQRCGSPPGVGWRWAWTSSLYFSAVKQTTIANPTVIGAFQPVLMRGLVGPILGERVRRADLGWSLLAIAGVAVVVFGSRSLPAAHLSGALLIPVAATFLGWAFIGEEAAAIQFVGMAIVIGALVLIVTGSRNTASDPAPQPAAT